MEKWEAVVETINDGVHPLVLQIEGKGTEEGLGPGIENEDIEIIEDLEVVLHGIIDHLIAIEGNQSVIDLRKVVAHHHIAIHPVTMENL